jgi:hypothetical protein
MDPSLLGGRNIAPQVLSSSEVNMFRRAQQRVLIVLVGVSLFAFLGSGEALAQQQVTITITNPTNKPPWTTGNGGSVTWTFSSGYSATRVRIVDANHQTSEYLNQSYAAPSSSPAFANFTVPTAESGKTTECYLYVETIGTMGTVVGFDTVTINVRTP